jgi:hypothetical protein
MLVTVTRTQVTIGDHEWTETVLNVYTITASWWQTFSFIVIDVPVYVTSMSRVLLFMRETPSQAPGEKLGDGAIIGIVCGIAVVLAIIIAAVVFIVRRPADDSDTESSNCELSLSTRGVGATDEGPAETFDNISTVEHQRSLRNFEDPQSFSHSSSADQEDGPHGSFSEQPMWI